MIDVCNTWKVLADVSRSSGGGRAQPLLLHSSSSFPFLESAGSSLKFKHRLLTEDTWQACVRAGKNSQPHTTSRHCFDEGLEKPLSLHSLLGQLAAAPTCGCSHPSLSVRRRRCRLGKTRTAAELERVRRSDVGFVWLPVSPSVCPSACSRTCSGLCASCRSPRGAPAGLLPF